MDLTLNMSYHFVLFRGGEPLQSVVDMSFEGDYIDKVQDCKNITAVFLLNYCFHFNAWTTRAYLERLFHTKLSVVRLMQRCPNSIVIIKLSHPRKEVLNVQPYKAAIYVYHDMDRMIRRMFDDIPVNYLDIWDLVLSHPSKSEIHVSPHVIRQEVFLMLSYICPEMVKSRQYM